MTKGRLEAFSDGVIAVIITIMVLELKPPEQWTVASLRPLIPTFLAYVLSFLYVSIYWNNHHHLFQVVERVNGRVLWANLYLLFWLSLVPMTTSWMGESEYARVPVIAYGVVLLMTAGAYYILTRALLAGHGPHSVMAHAVAGVQKEKLSLVIYGFALAGAFLHPLIACAGYLAVAILWVVPDSRIETALVLREKKE